MKLFIEKQKRQEFIMRQEVEEKKRKAEEIQEAIELKQIRDEMNKNYEVAIV